MYLNNLSRKNQIFELLNSIISIFYDLTFIFWKVITGDDKFSGQVQRAL